MTHQKLTSGGQHLPEDVATTFCSTLADEWLRLGVRHAVVAPGSRSTPMAVALIESNGFDVTVAHDERVAAFIALGIAKVTGVPAVLLCTSGTAAAHFHAAVVEASLSGVPMIVCTADRPPELRGVGAPQTIDQTKLYGSAVRWYHDPGVPDWDARYTWRHIAGQSLVRSLGLNRGPTHLNLPFREPLLGRVLTIPGAQETGSWLQALAGLTVLSTQQALAIAQDIVGKRGVIVAGGGCDGTPEILELAQVLDWPVLACPRSGYASSDVVARADLLMRSDEFKATHGPEVVLQFGEGFASKVVNQFLHSGSSVLMQISDREEVRDPSQHVSTIVIGSLSAIAKAITQECRDLGSDTPTHSRDSLQKWRDSWYGADRLATSVLDEKLNIDGLNEPMVARTVLTEAVPGSMVVVSSSMPIRDMEWFGDPRSDVTVIANRGANGIDGVISTAIGVALTSDLPTYLLIGDVAFLHDSSALVGLAGREIDLRIVVIDNDGGGIFSFLPQKAKIEQREFEALFGTPHGTDIAALAAAHNLSTHNVATTSDLRKVLHQPGLSVTVFKTERNENVRVHESINRSVIAKLRP